jgi:hypothetical protein
MEVFESSGCYAGCGEYQEMFERELKIVACLVFENLG